MTVTETIKVSSLGINIKRGIYRDFPTIYKDRFGNRYIIGFEVTEVLRDGISENYHFANLSNGKRVYIGRKDVFISPGEHTYTITYNTNRHIGFFEGFDVLYWNVTGNGWVFPIDEASATVALPKQVSMDELKLEGWTGSQGSKEKNFSSSFDDYGNINFSTTRPLNSYEGLTIAVAWPKGIVSEPTQGQRLYYFFRDNQGLIIGLFGLVALLFYYLVIWANVGKDPAKGTIIPLFEPPEGFSPSAVRYISRMGFDNKAFAALIIQMAVKGFLSIEEKNGVYTIVKNKNFKGTLSAEEKNVMDKLFSSNDSLKLTNENHSEVQNATASLKNSLKFNFEKVYFVINLQYFIYGLAVSISILVLSAFSGPRRNESVFVFMSVWLTIWSFGTGVLVLQVFNLWKGVIFSGEGSFKSTGSAITMSLFSIPFIIGEIVGLVIWGASTSLLAIFILFAIIFINVLFYHLLKAPTHFGRRILDSIEGFKMFLSVTEKDRLNLINPPHRTPELFEKFLPYALALDVEQAWAEQFSDVLSNIRGEDYAYTPSWYSGSGLNQFNTRGFSESLGNSLSGAIASSSIAPGTSSGDIFSGGGSSGGGGGGGGGGGW